MNLTSITEEKDFAQDIPDGVLYYTTTQKVCIAIVMTIVSMLTIFGNVIIIYVYNKVKRLQTARNLFLLSLSSADIVVGLISINLYTVYMLLSYWPFGLFLCYFWLIIDHWAFTISNLTLVAIACDRCLSIRFPIWHRNRFSKRYVKRVILVIWLIAFLIWSPAILFYPYLSERNVLPSNQCYIQFYFGSPYLTVTVATLSYFGPVLLITLSYAYICCYSANNRSSIVLSSSNLGTGQIDTKYSNIKVTEKTFKSNLNKDTMKSEATEEEYCNIPMKSEATEEEYCNIPRNGKLVLASVMNLNVEKDTTEYSINTNNIKCVVTSFNKNPCTKSNANRVSVKQQKLTFYTKIKSSWRGIGFLILVSLAFIVTWMSYHIMIVITSVTYTVISEHLWRFCYIIGWINSTINPCCYALYNKKFRRGFKEVFCRNRVYT